MPKLVTFSKLGDGGTVSVQGALSGNRTFTKDAIADLDDVLVPATPERPAITLEASLTAYAHLYEPYTVPDEPTPPTRLARRLRTEE